MQPLQARARARLKPLEAQAPVRLFEARALVSSAVLSSSFSPVLAFFAGFLSVYQSPRQTLGAPPGVFASSAAAHTKHNGQLAFMSHEEQAGRLSESKALKPWRPQGGAEVKHISW